MPYEEGIVAGRADGALAAYVCHAQVLGHGQHELAKPARGQARKQASKANGTTNASTPVRDQQGHSKK